MLQGIIECCGNSNIQFSCFTDSNFNLLSVWFVLHNLDLGLKVRINLFIYNDFVVKLDENKIRTQFFELHNFKGKHEINKTHTLLALQLLFLIAPKAVQLKLYNRLRGCCYDCSTYKYCISEIITLAWGSILRTRSLLPPL